MGISRDSAHKRRLTGGRMKPIRKKRKYEMGRQPANTKVGDQTVHKVRVRGGNFKFRALRLDHGNFTWIGEAVSCKTRILRVVYNATSNELVRTNTLVKSCIVQIDATPFKVWYKKYYSHVPGEKERKEVKDAPKKADKAKKVKKAKEEGKDKKEKKVRKSTTTLKQYKKMLLKVKANSKTQKLAALKEAREKKGKKDTKKGAQAKKEAPKKDDKKKEKKWQKPKNPPSADPNSKTHKALIARRNRNHHLDPHLEELFKGGRLLARITSRPGQVGRADGIILEGEELAFYQRKLKK